MRLKLTFLIVISNLMFINIGKCQLGKIKEKTLLEMKKTVVGIGTTQIQFIKKDGKDFQFSMYGNLGSGLMTYVLIDSFLFPVVVTAKHVIDVFVNNRIPHFFIRPSWADTIKTTEYFGTKIPLKDNSLPNYFYHPNTNIDLGCIIVNPIYFDSIFNEKVLIEKLKILPLNSISTPLLGNLVWIVGYPGHIVTSIQNSYQYSISTFKTGYIAWKPSENMNNTDLRHITIVESNATYGNSGGPVFSIENDELELVGIIQGGYSDTDSVIIDGKAVIEPNSKKPLLVESRSGASIIIKAQEILIMLEYVKQKIKSGQ